jgi:hypothetical protein
MSMITLPTRRDARESRPACECSPSQAWLELTPQVRAELEEEDDDLYGDDDVAELDDDELDVDELDDDDFDSDLDV